MATRFFAAEDGNLDRKTIIAARSRVFRDLDLSFADRPDGDVYRKNDGAAVKQAVKNILLTNNYEKPFLMDFGANLQGLLFELATEDVVWEIENRIKTTIEQYEPRVIVENVLATFNERSYDLKVRVEFKIVNYDNIEVLDVTLTRLR